MMNSMRMFLIGMATLSAYAGDDSNRQQLMFVGPGGAQGQGPHAVVMMAPAGGGKAQSGSMMFVPGQQVQVEMPAVWLGLRLTPIPAPLAAHVGSEGMMIANIAKNSPGDAAGLQQYDVFVSFGGKSVANMDELLTELRDASAGQDSEIVIIRNGKQQTLSIRPAARPSDGGNIEYKYEEPEAAVNSVQMRGKRMKLGPDGNWIVEDMGQLDQLPDALEELKVFDMGNWNQWIGRPGQPAPFGPHGLQNLSDLGRWNMFFSPDSTFNFDSDGVDDAKSSVSISIAKDGESLAITRDENGAFNVSKSDKDGSSSKATYDSAEAFRKADPDTYAKFREMTGGRPRVFFGQRADDGQLPQMQQDFQERVQKMIDEARAKVEEARKLAEENKAQQGGGRKR